MRPMCKTSSATELGARLGRAGRGSVLALAVAFVPAACTHQDGIVGTEPLASAPDGGSTDSGAPDSGPKTPTYRTDFDAADSWLPHNGLPGSSTNFGVAIAGAADPSTAELRFPGHPEYAATDNAGPSYDYLTQIESPQKFSFGTFRTRLQFGSCKASEEAVNAALGYFDDGSDADQDGITDHLEMDFQVLCGAPHDLYLTVFTENDATQFRKLSHMVDFSTGDTFDTVSAQDDTFTKTLTDATLVRPELFAPDSFYELGFEWHPSSLRFFLVIDGAERTLWTLTDPARIPQRPVSFLYNLWHPPTHWFPSTSAAAFPANDVILHVDWLEYYAE